MHKLAFKQKISFYSHSPFWKRIYHLIIREIAKFWLKLNPQVRIIAITGSFGKTYTAYILANLLKKTKQTVVKTDFNLDTIFNLPLTILKIRKKHRWAVFEVGVDHKNEMDFHLDLFKPNIVVFTGITPVHSEKDLLGSLEGIKKEKGKLVTALKSNGLLIYNFDDQNVREIALKCKAKKVSYSLSGKKADYFVEKYLIKPTGSNFWMFSNLTKRRLLVKTKLVGIHFANQFMIAFALAENEKINLAALRISASKISPLPGRMSPEKFINGSYLLNDRLRANPASTRAGLETLKILGKFFERKIIIMGEMGELGTRADFEHREIGKIINQETKPDYFIGIGPLTKKVAEGINKKNIKVFLCDNPLQAAEILEKAIRLKRNDIVYIKASLLRHLERIELKLKGKTVNCQVVSCPFYHSCESCQYLETGYSV